MDDIVDDVRSTILEILLYDAATGEPSATLHEYGNPDSIDYRIVALFCYDYCLTFAQEVHHIWPLRLSVPSLLFFAVRYPALFSTVFIILDQTQWRGITDASCTVMVRTQMALNIVLLTSAAIFSALRAYALCGRSPWMLALVMLMGLVNPAMSLVSFVHSGTALFAYPVSICGFYSVVSGTTFENCTHLSLGTGRLCKVLIWASLSGMIAARTTSVAADALVLVITWIKTWSFRRETPPVNFASRVTTMLMRDGTIYFMVLLIINLVALGLSRAFQLIEAISTWIAILTSIMMSRFILDLHAAARPHTLDNSLPSLTIPVSATATAQSPFIYGVLSTEISVDGATLSCGSHDVVEGGL